MNETTLCYERGKRMKDFIVCFIVGILVSVWCFTCAVFIDNVILKRKK